MDDISSGLHSKLIEESLFEDGMSELLMIVSKNSKLCELVNDINLIYYFVNFLIFLLVRNYGILKAIHVQKILNTKECLFNSC